MNLKKLVSILTIVLAVVSYGGWAHGDQAKVKLEPIDSGMRAHYIERAQIWHKTDIPNMDILAGPQNDISVPPDTEVTCQYVEWQKKPSGATPKFLCKLAPSGTLVRVKYGQSNREMYAEIAASRLFWALGFYADEYYPVKIRCLGCPEKSPWKPEKGERRIERFFEFAMIERQFPGIPIESSRDEGLNLQELQKVDAKKGGAPKEQIDAFKLLLVLVQHGDQKPDQQRLACYYQSIEDPDRDGVGICGRPVMMVQDLGSTFGTANQFTGPVAKMDFSRWKETPVWNHFKEKKNYDLNGQHACFGNLTSSILAKHKGLTDPAISEAGRQFLADLLMQLTDQQIRDLFQVARADQMGDVIEKDGTRMTVGIQDWVSEFKKKREDIVKQTCPS